MIDDTGLMEFNGPSRARRQVFTLAAVSLAAACAETVPADEAVVAELSGSQVLALCDELRDAVQRNDQPIECDGGNEYWVLPSNQSCLSADLSSCTATVGQLRRCHELARQDPCSLTYDALSPVDLSPIEPGTGLIDCQSLDGCYPLAPITEYAGVPACTEVGLESLRSIDGVYEVALDLQSPGQCADILPELLEMDAPYFVLVSTEASEVPEVILQSCNALPDCQALAREIQAAASPRGATPYHHLLGCGTPLDSEPFFLHAFPADASCQAAWLPQVSVSGDPSSLLVMVSNLSDPPEVSPGCGYIISSARRDPGACVAFVQYRAVRVSAL